MRGICGGRIKGVLRKRKDEKVMKDCQRAQVGKRAGLLVLRSQNRITEIFNFERTSFLLAAYVEVCIHLPSKQAPEPFTFVLACTVQTHVNEAKQHKSAELTATMFLGAPCLWFQTHADAQRADSFVH